MMDAKPAVAALAAPPSHLPYAARAPRAQWWRVAAGIAALVLGCLAMLAGFVTVWYTWPWTMRTETARIVLALAAYTIQFLAGLATALFGLALLCRSPRAWHAAVAYFCLQLVHPIVALAMLPFVSRGLWKQGTPESYFQMSGYLSGAAGLVTPLLLLALLTRPLVHEMIEQWSRGDGGAARG